MCNDAARTACANELKHMQDHDVFEVVWLSEIKCLTKMRSKCLEDTIGSVVKARFEAQQVAYRERDDVFAGTPPLANARTLLAVAASRNPKEDRYIGLFSIRPLTSGRAHRHHSASWDCPARSGTLVATCTVRNAPSVEALSENLLKGLELRLGGLKAKCFHERCATPAVRPRARVTVTNFFAEASLDKLGTVEATLRNHFETKRLAVVCPSRHSEDRFLKRTVRWVKHKRCFTWSGDPAQAQQATHMCDLDRAVTKAVTRSAVEDSRQRDGDEPVNDEQTFWFTVLLVCWDIWQRTRLTCNTLSRFS